MKWAIILLLLAGCAKPEPMAMFDWDNQQWAYRNGKDIKGLKTIDKILDRR